MTIKKILSLRAFARKRGNLLLIKLNFKINSITLDYFGLRPRNESVKKDYHCKFILLVIASVTKQSRQKYINT